MGRVPVGYTHESWNALPVEERERIKKIKYSQRHMKNYYTDLEKHRNYNNEVYYRNRESRKQKAREYQQRKKAEQEILAVELEKYKALTQQLEAKLARD